MLGIDIAKTKIGLQEKDDNTELRQFLKENSRQGDIDVDPATTPWCACFVNACEREAGNKGTGMQNARSFLDYGHIIPLAEIKYGDICVFPRANSSWQGHVTYFEKWDNGALICIGGNQADEVCEERFSPKSLLGIRRP